ncbi:uncharacterized protein LOC134804062 [Cydia splendana]|uniref:uncharacterized protein LOC134804062 n=1 Tax=Cydia splendana TaxID=1100963 RepID=UPI0028F4B928
MKITRYFVFMTAVLWAQLPVSCMAQEELFKIFNWILIDCRTANSDCLMMCVFSKMEIITEEQEYDEREMLDWMKFPVDMGLLTQDQANQIAAACNRVNEVRTTACSTGEEVRKCLSEEIHNVMGVEAGSKDEAEMDITAQQQERWNQIATECNHKEICIELCVYKETGILDKDGWYVESKALKWMKFFIAAGNLTQSRANRVAAACNRVNQNISSEECERGLQVARCIVQETEKGQVILELESLYLMVIHCRKTEPACLLWCMFEKMAILLNSGWYVELKMLEWMKIPIDMGLFSQDQAINIAGACNRVNDQPNDNLCDKGEQLRECLNSEIDQVLNNKDNGNEMEPGQEGEITPERLKSIEEYCQKTSNESCFALCKLTSIGVIDEHGQYVESKAMELIKNYLVPLVLLKVPTRMVEIMIPRLIEVPKLCSRVNEHITMGCQRGEEVQKCIQAEGKTRVFEAKAAFMKTLEDKVKNCAPNCDALCAYEVAGLVDKNGYVNTEMIKWIRYRLPEEMVLNESVPMEIFDNCLRVITHITTDCQGADTMEMCIMEGLKKYFG